MQIHMTTTQVDALAVAFTIFASVWLFSTVAYMVTVCLFFRMRNRGQLSGSMSDPAWGRVYLFGSPTYYISMGWIFRRYAMHQLRSSEERNRIARIRVMTVEERRDAIKELLQPTIFDEKNQLQPSYVPEQAPTCSHPSLTTMAELTNVTPSTGADDGNKKDDLTRDSFVVGADADNVTICVRPEKPYYEFHLNRPSDNSSEPSQISSGDNKCSSVNDTTVICIGIDHMADNSQNLELSPQHRKSEINKNLQIGGDTEEDETHSLSSSAGGCNVECPICFVAYTDGQQIFDSPKCTHRFHWDCILSWLQIQCNRECPCCRTDILDEELLWKTLQQNRKEERHKRKRDKGKRQMKSWKFICDTNHQSNNIAAIRRGATEDEDDLHDDNINDPEFGANSALMDRESIRHHLTHVDRTETALEINNIQSQENSDDLETQSRNASLSDREGDTSSRPQDVTRRTPTTQIEVEQ